MAGKLHIAVEFWSRWLTPLFQSDRDLVASVRDIGMGPLGRLPGSRGHMLRVLSGTQQGMFGKRVLAPAFLADLDRLNSIAAAPVLPAAIPFR